jgi:hypothetical protein
MAKLDAFHSRILPHIPSAPLPTVDQAIVDACVEFCEQSLVVRSRLDPTFTAPKSEEVEIDLDSGMRLAHAISVVMDGYTLTPSTVDGIFNSPQMDGRPTHFATTPEGTLLLYPTPNASYPIRIHAAVTPKRSATAVPDKLAEEWPDVIAAGALFRLFSMPSEWVNPALAKNHFDLFRVGLNRAMLQATRERSGAESRVRPVHI